MSGNIPGARGTAADETGYERTCVTVESIPAEQGGISAILGELGHREG